MKKERKSTDNPEFKFIETEGELRDRNSALELENSDLETRNSDLKSKNTDLQTKNFNLRTKNSDLKTKNSDLKSRNSDLLRQLKEQKALSSKPKLTMQDVLSWDTMEAYALSLANHRDVQVIANMLNCIATRYHYWDPRLTQCIETIEQYVRDLQRNVYTQTNHIAGDYVEHQTNQSKTKRK